MASSKTTPTPEPGTPYLGNFRLIRELGRGGLSKVFLAEQQQPVRRKVALKMFHSALDQTQLASFFHREKQILAKLEHPYIAHFYHGGLSPAGWPYLVMEYVPGMPFMDFCKQKLPRLQDRLHLFLKVCDAVLFAHQSGIIHRDLKPSNILVSEINGEPEPKLIDFGISQVFGEEWETTLHQRSPTLAGTPVYMSPEQAGLADVPIDIRTDIYALGMILYQVVTGFLPFDTHAHSATPQCKLHPSHSGKEIPLPSERLRQLRDQGKTETKGLKSRIRNLRGDLDWIVLKALAQNPEKRYRTVQQLKQEITCYLEGQPLVSRPVSSWFLFHRFVKRNRWPVLSGLVLAATIVAGYIGLSWGLIKAQEAERKAVIEKNRANYTLTLVGEMLTSADPSADGIDVKAIDILSRFGDRSDWQNEAQPEVRAGLHYLIGKTFFGLGEFTQSSSHLEKAFALATEDFKEGHPKRLEIIGAYMGQKLQTGDLNRALELVQTYYPEAKHHLPLDNQVFLNFSHLSAGVYLTLGILQPAEDILLPFLAVPPQERSRAAGLYLRIEWQMANTMLVQGHFSEAKQFYEQLHDAFQTHFGAQAPATMELRHNLGTCYLYLDQPHKAEMNFKQNLADEAPMYHQGNPRQRPAMMGLVLALLDQAKYRESLQRACEFLTVNENEPLENPTASILAKALLARAQWENHHIMDAKENYEQAFRDYEAHVGTPNFQHTYIQYVLAILAKDFQHLERAEHLATANFLVYRLAKGIDHPDTRERLFLLTEVLILNQNLNLANPNLETLVSKLPNHPRVLHLQAQMAFRQTQYAAALAAWDHALAKKPQNGVYEIWRLRTLLKLGNQDLFKKGLGSWLETTRPRSRQEMLQADLLLKALEASKFPMEDPFIKQQMTAIATVLENRP